MLIINLLFFMSCTAQKKFNLSYERIGVVDSEEDGICTIEIDDALFHDYSPTIIHVYSKSCKEGDVLAIGRKASYVD